MSKEEKNKDFKRLVFYNKLFSYGFSSIILVVYFSFILILAFKPEIFGFYPFDNSLTIGILVGLTIILASILLTIVYVIISNFFLDKLKRKIK